MKLKLALIIIVAGITTAAATTTYSQMAELSLDMRNTSLEQVLDEIEKQSEFYFVFNQKQIDVNRTVDIKVKQVLINDVLPELFKGTDVNYVILDRQILLTTDPVKDEILEILSTINQQQVKIIGTVTDASTGEPLTGVYIVVKGTSNGTISDVEGNFSLPVTGANPVLVFSFIGYTSQEIAVDGKTIINVALETDVIGLEEIVVVGYGTMKKRDLTGSVASISSEKLKERSHINALQSIAGQVAGVQIQQTQGSPGFNPTVKVRGISTITAGTTPLYVIDGIPLEEVSSTTNKSVNANPLNAIDPHDIESIEILKDASSAAIYGSRGANGVVLITTKQGKAGKAIVDINYERGMQTVARRVELMNSQEFIQMYISALDNSGRHSSIPQEFLNDPGKFGTTDWQDVVFRDVATSDNVHVSVSGGNDKAKYMLSGSYLSQEGVVDRANYQRFMIRSNVKYKITDNLETGINFSITKVKAKIYGTEGKEGAVSLAIQNTPIFPVYNEVGTLGFRDPNSEWSRFNGKYLQQWHPYALTRELDNNANRLNMLTTGYLQYKFLNGFSFRTSLSLASDANRYDDYRNEGEDWGYSSWRASLANAHRYFNDNWLSENILSYDNAFGEHSLNALIGYTAQKNLLAESRQTSTSFPNDLVHTLNAGTPSTSLTEELEWSLISYIGRFNYSFKDRYLLTATIRRDGSSRFGADNKWGYFPSASFAWKVSEESFLQNAKWLYSLKFRLSYGVTGNNLIPNYGAIALLGQRQYAWGTSSSNVQRGIYPTSMSNPELRWEKTGQFNIGLNAGLFNNRIYFEADYYISKTKDLLLNVPVPIITGFSTQLTNIGKVQNKGFEFLITSKNLVREFQWETTFNLSMNRNKVLKLGTNDAPILITNWGTTITEIGQPVANFYGYKWDGVFMNAQEVEAYPHIAVATPGDPRIVDVTPDGVIDEKDRTLLGNAQPDFTYGITNNFSFKNFDLSILLQGSVGNEVINSETRYSKWFNEGRNAYKVYTNYWKSEAEPGDGKHIKPYLQPPAMYTQFSSYWVEDASFLRISNIRLGYNFSSKITSILHLTSLRLYANMDNVYCFTNYLGYDPENSVFTNALSSGEDYGAHPIPRTVTFGIKFGL